MKSSTRAFPGDTCDKSSRMMLLGPTPFDPASISRTKSECTMECDPITQTQVVLARYMRLVSIESILRSIRSRPISKNEILLAEFKIGMRLNFISNWHVRRANLKLA
jgi:hypothetical protein